MVHGYRAVLVLCGLWLAACGSVSKEDFDGKLAEALCERYVRCGVYLEKGACEREVSQLLVPRYGLGQKYDSALSQGRTRYDAGVAGACLEKLRSGSCDESPLSSQITWMGFGVADGCRFLIGDAADGDTCGSMAECGPRSFCTSIIHEECAGTCRPWLQQGEALLEYSRVGCAPGLVAGQSTCEEPKLVDEGQSCGSALSRCKPGLYCAPYDYVCHRYGAEGDACSRPGAPGPACSWSLVCVDGTCRKRSGEGADCRGVSASSAELFLTCGKDFFCDARPDERGTCRALLSEGASCRGSHECAADLYCVEAGPTTPTAGTCQRRSAQVGELCNASRECAAPADCFSHTCQTYDICRPYSSP